MKKIILVALSLLSSFAVHAGPWDYTFGQYDQFGVSPIPRLIILPSGGASGIFIHNASTNLPMLATVDTSLAISSGGVISVNAANFATTTALNAKFDNPTGTTAQYLRGDGTLATFPSIPASQIQSDWAQASSSSLDYIKNKPSLAAVATSGAYADLTGKPTIPPAITLTTTGSGAATYNSGTGALNIPTPTGGSGTVTSITAGTGLSGGTITTSGTISLPNTGTAGTYSGVTTDAQGRVTAGTTRSFSYSARSLNNCFQVSSTRDALVSYSVDISTTSTLLAGQVGTVYLRTYTNNTCSTGTQEVARFMNGNTQTLGVSVTMTQNVTGTLTGVIPAGAYVQLVSENNASTPTFTYRSGQEVQL